MAFYRKYRPKNFTELFGQEHIVTILKNTAAQDRFAHAYLFYGPRGTGKTTTARLLAKVANCDLRRTDPAFAKKGEPCNECSACLAIDAGNALDVIEIDAASNRGIDEIRDLKENIKTLPSYLRFKIFIIDEVHMLTPQAFNALLKTLEEPPTHILFILATTEYEKVLPTIVSRTQRFHFQKLGLPDIVTNLKDIAEKEGITYEPEALEMIAYLSDGSMRDAQSLLDQIASLKEGAITVAHAERILGRVDFAKTVAMADLLIANNLPDTLTYLHEVANAGYNLFQFNKDIAEYLRRALSLRLNPSLETIFAREVAGAQLIELKKHAQQLDVSKTITLIKAFIEAYAQMRYNPFPIAPFEVALIENLSK